MNDEFDKKYGIADHKDHGRSYIQKEDGTQYVGYSESVMMVMTKGRRNVIFKIIWDEAVIKKFKPCDYVARMALSETVIKAVREVLDQL